jgi:hypothetical protein
MTRSTSVYLRIFWDGNTGNHSVQCVSQHDGNIRVETQSSDDDSVTLKLSGLIKPSDIGGHGEVMHRPEENGWKKAIDDSAFPVGQVFMNRWDAVLAGFVGQSPSPYADVYKRILSSPAPESRGQS